MTTAHDIEQQLIDEIVRVQVEYRQDSNYYTPEQSTAEYVKDQYGYFDSAMNEIEDLFYPNQTIALPSGNISIEESVGGGEGDGEERYLVFRFVGNDGKETLYRVDGYYASWDGSNWDSASLYEVEKVPVQAYDYKRVR